jgi:hypothetical protein
VIRSTGGDCFVFIFCLFSFNLIVISSGALGPLWDRFQNHKHALGPQVQVLSLSNYENIWELGKSCDFSDEAWTQSCHPLS